MGVLGVPLFLSVQLVVSSTCSFLYSHQSRRWPLTAHFMLSSGYISFQEWILLLFTPPLSPRRTELFVLLTNQPLMGKKASRWPILSNLLKLLQPLQLITLVMFVLAFSFFFRTSVQLKLRYFLYWQKQNKSIKRRPICCNHRHPFIYMSLRSS